MGTTSLPGDTALFLCWFAEFKPAEMCPDLLSSAQTLSISAVFSSRSFVFRPNLQSSIQICCIFVQICCVSTRPAVFRPDLVSYVHICCVPFRPAELRRHALPTSQMRLHVSVNHSHKWCQSRVLIQCACAVASHHHYLAGLRLPHHIFRWAGNLHTGYGRKQQPSELMAVVSAKCKYIIPSS